MRNNGLDKPQNLSLPLTLRRFWLQTWVKDVSSSCRRRVLSGVTQPSPWDGLAVPRSSSGRSRLGGTCPADRAQVIVTLLQWSRLGPDPITPLPQLLSSGPPLPFSRCCSHVCSSKTLWSPLLLGSCCRSSVQLHLASLACCWLNPRGVIRGWDPETWARWGESSTVVAQVVPLWGILVGEGRHQEPD